MLSFSNLFYFTELIFLQIKCTINMDIEQITSIKWLIMKLYQKLITSLRFNYLRAYGEPATNDRSNLTILSEQHSIKHCSALIVLSLNRPKLNRKQR